MAHKKLLDNAQVKRWYDNVSRASELTAEYPILNFIFRKKAGSNVMIARVKQMLAAEVGFPFSCSKEKKLCSYVSYLR